MTTTKTAKMTKTRTKETTMYLFFVALDLVKLFFPDLVQKLPVIIISMTQPLLAMTQPELFEEQKFQVVFCQDRVDAEKVVEAWYQDSEARLLSFFFKEHRCGHFMLTHQQLGILEERARDKETGDVARSVPFIDVHWGVRYLPNPIIFWDGSSFTLRAIQVQD